MAKGQRSVEFRATPKVSIKPEIVNPSPAQISSQSQFSYEFGANYTHMLNGKWGVGAGIITGQVVYRMDFVAPSAAFGTKQDKGIISTGFYFDSYHYHAVSARAIHRTVLNERSFINILAEPSLRYYTYGTDNYDSLQVGFNRAMRFNPDNPATLPPDLLVGIPATGRRVYLNIAVSIGLERKVSARSSLVFGIKSNFGLKPIAAGLLQVQMNDKLYTGKFNTRSGFTGLDLVYKYSLSKSEELIKRSMEPHETGRYRKAIFIEGIGNGLGLSGNFDMRLRPGRNDGPGFRAGVGYSGESYTNNQVQKYMSIPLAYNYVFRNERSGIETGMGLTPTFIANKTSQGRDLSLGIFYNLGYRLQPLNEGLLVRAMWTPAYMDGSFISLAGVSLGYSFR